MNPETTPQPSTPPSKNSGVGYLIVHATTARGAIPLEGAQITVRDYKPEFTEPRGDVIVSTVTGRDGNSERIALPAPAKNDSLSPGNGTPFSIYNLEVRLDGYRGQSYFALPIFDGITAIQPVDLVPLPENGTADAHRPSEDRFYESMPPNL
jgi:hypothetical protein